jgi:cobalamin synthase
MNSSPQHGAMRQLLQAMRVPAPTKFAPLVGLFIGAVSGAIYWLASQLWPSSIASLLAMLASTFLTSETRNYSPATLTEVLSQVFYLLLKYAVLLALSAAKLPFAVPANVGLGLIMVCGYGASRALFVSMLVSQPPTIAPRISHLDLGVALLIGFGPAVLLGVPGLVGLAMAIVATIGLGSYIKLSGSYGSRTPILLAPLLAEVSFYLGAQASWSYIT